MQLRISFHKIAVVAFLLGLINFTMAQDIEQVIKGPILTSNGGFSFSQVGTYTTDSIQTSQPFAYYLSGNINSTLYGVVHLPVSFSYTNNSSDYQTPNPFNHFSLAPSYKWIKTYIGYSTMEFSPYTLSGHEFLGGGVELTPGNNFKFMAMGGRLTQAVNPDSIGSNIAYMKVGAGMKLEYRHEKIVGGINFFKAKDDINSVHYPAYDSSFVKPEDNFTWGANLRAKPMDNLEVIAEFGMSMLNQDISNNNSDFFNGIVDQNGELVVFYAYNGSLIQTTKIGKIGLSYERVDPNYKTLGAYYSNNDFENITADFSTEIKDWLSLAVSAGFQKDNLAEQNTSTSNRNIYSVNASSNITQKLTVSGMFSNLSSYVHIKNIYDLLEQTNQYQNLDTLSFTQINLSASGNVNYNLEATKTQTQNLNFGFSYQQVSDEKQGAEMVIGSRIYNSNIAYQYGFIPLKLNISSSANVNTNVMPSSQMNLASYNVSVNKVFWDKFKTALSSTYSHSLTSDELDTKIFNLRYTVGYTIRKKHNLNLNMAMVNRKSMLKNVTQYSGNLAYSYMFNFNVKQQDKKMKFNGDF